MIEKVEKAVKKQKNNKGVGIDGVPGKLLKHGGKAIITCLHKICNQVWKKESVPTSLFHNPSSSPSLKEAIFNPASTTTQYH